MLRAIQAGSHLIMKAKKVDTSALLRGGGREECWIEV